MPEVAAVDINFQQKTATVTTKAGQSLTKNRVEEVLKAKGYGVTAFSPQSQ